MCINCEFRYYNNTTMSLYSIINGLVLWLMDLWLFVVGVQQRAIKICFY